MREPRLYIHLILCCRESAFASVWAVVCSSWVQINCFTSCRSILCPEGDQSKRYVECANTMMSRILDQNKTSFVYATIVYPVLVFVIQHFVDDVPSCAILYTVQHELRCVLLLALTVACGGSFMLEQPRSSVMGEYFRMQWLCQQVKATCLIYMFLYIVLSNLF